MSYENVLNQKIPALQNWFFHFAAASHNLSAQCSSSAERLGRPDDRSFHTPTFPMHTSQIGHNIQY